MEILQQRTITSWLLINGFDDDRKYVGMKNEETCIRGSLHHRMEVGKQEKTLEH